MSSEDSPQELPVTPQCKCFDFAIEALDGLCEHEIKIVAFTTYAKPCERHPGPRLTITIDAKEA